MMGPDENGKPITMLLIEDNPGDARLLKVLLSESKQASFSIDIANRLSQGMDRAENDHYDAVLLDLGLPDSHGLDTFIKLNTAFKHLPIVVLSGMDDESVALTAVQEGAQDYLVKGQVDGHTLWRSIRYAIERKRAERQKDLSFKIMDLLNKKGDRAALIHAILLLIKDFSGCEAVGIRLREEDDYPYYEANGFVPGHVEMENRLCAYDENGKIISDSQGNPVLECMCGNIILGRFDPTLPFFTTGGSFWSNCTTELLATTTDEDRQARTRNKCNGEGYESVALIPLKGEDGNIGLLQLNDTRRERFTSDIITYYESIANGVGIVLARKLAEEQLVKSYESLKKTLNDAINTMVKMVEMRDPYTAGHQQKVAGLATAIAREMKLEDTRIEHLRMASAIHDIGKMYIPSDILSKPGRLSEIEFSLIKTHAQSGYDIVKGMDFPGGVAQAVLQHHERLDGSGYPNQLKGEATLLEAKILAVADVIEAMASHRPYRPALGIDKALHEIDQNKGKLFDPDVVDICLRLFREKSFSFEA